MSARQKLNSAYAVGIVLISGFIGLMTESVAVFIICAVLLAAKLVHGGTIRMQSTRR